MFCFSQQEVSNLIKAIKTKERLQNELEEYKLTCNLHTSIEPKNLEYNSILPTHYSEIARAPEEKQLEIAQKIVDEKLTTKQTRKFIKELKIGDEQPNWSEIVKEFILEREWLRSLVDYPDRGPFGSGDFPGNASGWLLVQLIDLFQPESVFDPMEGSGTSREVCEAMNIEYYGNDLKNPDGYDLTETSIVSLPSVELTYFHPPYHNIIKYTNHPHDLSNQATYKNFLKLLFVCIDKLLKKTKILVILVGDIFDKETFEYWSIGGDIFQIYRDRLIWRIVKTQHSVSSGFADQALKRRNPYYIPLRHEDVYLLRGDRHD